MSEHTFNCIITGHPVEMDEAYIKKMLKRKYTLDFLKGHFICKKALKLLKNGETIEMIRLKLQSGSQRLITFEQLIFNGIKYKHDLKMEEKQRDPVEIKRKRYTAEQKEAIFKEYVEHHTKNDICIRPDIFLDNNRSCTKCPYEKYCTTTGRNSQPDRIKENKKSSNELDVILEIT